MRQYKAEGACDGEGCSLGSGRPPDKVNRTTGPFGGRTKVWLNDCVLSMLWGGGKVQRWMRTPSQTEWNLEVWPIAKEREDKALNSWKCWGHKKLISNTCRKLSASGWKRLVGKTGQEGNGSQGFYAGVSRGNEEVMQIHQVSPEWRP